jgi:hypothetical protein
MVKRVSGTSVKIASSIVEAFVNSEKTIGEDFVKRLVNFLIALLTVVKDVYFVMVVDLVEDNSQVHATYLSILTSLALYFPRQLHSINGFIQVFLINIMVPQYSLIWMGTVS